ncbi:MAG: GAF domain-containing protein, partial [Deltaproteobacteria bacterium]|nr:GAF domain-containing protein [Deltaproteobacteria bacterium]
MDSNKTARTSEPLSPGAEADLRGELARQGQRFRAIQEIARAAGSTLDIDELLRVIVSTVTAQMHAERSTLYMLTADGRELWTRVLEADEVQEIRLEVGTGIAGWVAARGEPVNIRDAYEDERFSKTIDEKTGYRTRSILCVPMRNPHGDITGVVQVLNKQDVETGGAGFSDEDHDLLVTLASQAAIALENSNLYQSVVRKNQQLLVAQTALERRMRERDLLLEMQRQVNEAMSLDELLERLLTRTSDLVGAQAAAILLRDDATGRLFFRSALGERGAEVKRLSLDAGQGVAGWVTMHGKPVRLDDPASDPRHSREVAAELDFFPRNILCVPLNGQDETLGAVELLSKRGGGSFDVDDERLLSLIAGSIAQAIDLARYKEQRLQESRLASIGQMLSGVLHDLKTPMTVISGYAQLMAASDAQDVRQEYVDQILRQFEVMAAMTREVLAFARGESNVLIRKVYLHKYIAEIEEHLRHELAGKNI